MCITFVVHFTRCETRRPAIINPHTGACVYHPLEPPAECEHAYAVTYPQCKYHGHCCYPGKVYICNALQEGENCRGWQPYHVVVDPSHMHSSGLLDDLREITDWSEFEKSDDAYSYEEDIRRDFFDIGADIWDLAHQGDDLTIYLLEHDTASPGHELGLFEEHGALYAEWKTKLEEMTDMTEAWQSLAHVGCMESCPADQPAWPKAFKQCSDTYFGFPMFYGTAFRWLDNIQNQDELFESHPYYSQKTQGPWRSARAERLWRTPSPPRPANTDPALRAEINFFGESMHCLKNSPPQSAVWNDYPEELALTPTLSARRKSSVKFGPVSWSNSATRIDSPPVSPHGLSLNTLELQTPPGVTHLIPSVENPFNIELAENPFGDRFESEWAMPEENTPMNDVLHVPAPVNMPGPSPAYATTSLKRRRDDTETVEQKRHSSCDGWVEVENKRRRTW
ncbi:hypothetical protein FDECE_5123 [Fusarium decemcellulare]|nr:hypothetical protein FDECE_5123 [Fusarium decemcellulare]